MFIDTLSNKSKCIFNNNVYSLDNIHIDSNVCQGNNIAIARSGNNLVYTYISYNWTLNSFDTVDDASIFCYNNGTFVWSQPNKDVNVKYSTDSINWSDSSFNKALTSISADGAGFVGIRDGVLYRSTNGINWKVL